MTTPAEYRDIAEECLEAMRGTTSPEVRAELLRLALRWEEIADEIERDAEWSQVTAELAPAAAVLCVCVSVERG